MFTITSNDGFTYYDCNYNVVSRNDKRVKYAVNNKTGDKYIKVQDND